MIPAVIFKTVKAAAHPLTEPVCSAPASCARMEIGLVADICHDSASRCYIESQCIRQIEERCILITCSLSGQRRRYRRNCDHDRCEPCDKIFSDKGETGLSHNNSFF